MLNTSTIWNKIIEKYLEDDTSISELETNGDLSVFVRKKGKRIEIPNVFESIEQYRESIKYLIQRINRDAPDSPRFIEEGTLKLRNEGIARCHIMLPPACDEPMVTIARKTQDLTTLDDLEASGSFNKMMGDFIRAAVDCDMTISLSGSTGSGKDVAKNTMISTVLGLRKLEDVKVGDIIFDENGQKTKVVKKHSPEEKNFYRITFKDGTEVEAGGGHIWKVLELNKYIKYGHKTKPLFTEDDIKRIKAELKQPDTLVTNREILDIISGEKNKYGLRESGMPKVLYNTIQGLGRKGKDLFSFNIDEVIENIKTKFRYEETRKLCIALLNEYRDEKKVDTITIRDLKEVLDNRHIVRTLIGNEMESASKMVFYTKNEILQFLLDEDAERKQRRLDIDESYSKNKRPTALYSTDELFDIGVRNNQYRLNFAIESIRNPIDYDKQDLFIDPYVLGVWLGDGYSADNRFCGIDLEIFEKVKSIYSKSELVSQQEDINRNIPLNIWKIVGIKEKLEDLDLINNKHIPNIYKISSIEQRKELLAGIIDTDGYVSENGSIDLDITNKDIAYGFREIAMSLGYSATRITTKTGKYKNEEGKIIECKEVYRVTIHPTDMLDLQVPRKKDCLEEKFSSNKSQQSRHERHYITNIEKIEGRSEDYYCLGVDSPYHTYLVSDSFIPTHNTTMLEAITKLWPNNIRIGVVEDAPELRLIQDNVAYLHSSVAKPGQAENANASLQWCVAQLNRMRVDKMIIGETRGPEFASFLTAANSGNEGSLTTIHANDPEACLKKMNQFVNLAQTSPQRVINQNIASTIDLIIQLNKTPQGKYRTTFISEVTRQLGNDDSATIATQPIFEYNEATDDWRYTPVSDYLSKRFTEKGYNSKFIKEIGQVNNEDMNDNRLNRPRFGFGR